MFGGAAGYGWSRLWAQTANPLDLTLGTLNWFTGYFAEVEEIDRAHAVVSAKDPTTYFSSDWPRNYYLVGCGHTFGDAGCGFDKSTSPPRARSRHLLSLMRPRSAPASHKLEAYRHRLRASLALPTSGKLQTRPVWPLPHQRTTSSSRLRVPTGSPCPVRKLACRLPDHHAEETARRARRQIPHCYPTVLSSERRHRVEGVRGAVCRKRTSPYLWDRQEATFLLRGSRPDLCWGTGISHLPGLGSAATLRWELSNSTSSGARRRRQHGAVVRHYRLPGGRRLRGNHRHTAAAERAGCGVFLYGGAGLQQPRRGVTHTRTSLTTRAVTTCRCRSRPFEISETFRIENTA